MNRATVQHEWANFLRFFSEQNAGRSTRLCVFEPSRGVAADYWLECGLPLVGIDLDARDEAPSVQIMVGSLTHEIKNAVKLSCQFTTAGNEDGLDILDSNGRMTVLRFEAGKPAEPGAAI